MVFRFCPFGKYALIIAVTVGWDPEGQGTSEYDLKRDLETGQMELPKIGYSNPCIVRIHASHGRWGKRRHRHRRTRRR
jgi:hypothetical protein